MTLTRVAIVVVGSFVLASYSTAGLAQDRADRVGFDLLDRLVVTVVGAVVPGGGATDIDQNVLLLSKELRAARDGKRVDDLFAVRYARLLSAIRQAAIRDPDLLYWPMYRFNMIDFIEERTGRMPDWDKLLFIVNDHGGSGVGLGMLAEAVLSEVVSLHIHLETVARRGEIVEGYRERAQKAIAARR